MQKLAQEMWGAYAKQAGGGTFDGKPLPSWEELGEDRQSCWIAAAKCAADRCAKVIDDRLAFMSTLEEAYIDEDNALKNLAAQIRALGE